MHEKTDCALEDAIGSLAFVAFEPNQKFGSMVPRYFLAARFLVTRFLVLFLAGAAFLAVFLAAFFFGDFLAAFFFVDFLAAFFLVDFLAAAFFLVDFLAAFLGAALAAFFFVVLFLVAIAFGAPSVIAPGFDLVLPLGAQKEREEPT